MVSSCQDVIEREMIKFSTLNNLLYVLHKFILLMFQRLQMYSIRLPVFQTTTKLLLQKKDKPAFCSTNSIGHLMKN